MKVSVRAPDRKPEHDADLRAKEDKRRKPELELVWDADEAEVTADPWARGFLERGDPPADPLEDAWAEATAGAPAPLPHREALEASFGRPLGHIEVHTGPAARALLDRLGAEAATRGDEVLLAEPEPAPSTVAHEVAHVLQVDEADDVGLSEEAPAAIAAEDHPAEAEAERVADAVAAGGAPGAPAETLPGGAIALRRTVRNEGDPELDLPPITVPERTEPVRTRRREADGEGTGAGRVGAETSVGTATQTEDRAARPTGRGTREGAEARREALQGPEQARAPPAPSPDRQEQLRDALDLTQDTWDGSAETADNHVVDTCPGSANAPDGLPFARGPPLEVPALRTDEPADPPAFEAPDLDEALEDEREAVDEVVGSSTGRSVRSAATAAARENRRQLERVADDAAARQRLLDPDTPTLELTDRADPDRATTDQEAFDAERERLAQDAEAATTEDFGETRMAPEEDPTLGHDAELDELPIAEVQVEDVVDQDALTRVPTMENVGVTPIDELVLVEDAEAEAADVTAAAHAEHRERVDAALVASGEQMTTLCREATADRARRQQATETEVTRQRGAWSRAASEHVDLRQREADTLVTEHLDHVEDIRLDAEANASATLEAAQTEADDQWENAEDVADAKAKEGEDQSLLDQAVEVVQDALAAIADWIRDFFAAAREVLDDLLDAAAELAHDIVDAAHGLITTTLDLLHDGLDFIADNLPGELGDLAREHRDDIHEFLDGVQAEVDQAAEDLHEDIDEAVEWVREELHDALDALEEGILAGIELVNDILEDGLMAVLWRLFPAFAELIDLGLSVIIDPAADALADWLETLLEVTGLNAMLARLEELHEERFCSEQDAEEAAEDCAAFEALLQKALAKFDELLESPVAQAIQGWLQEQRDEAAEEQADALEGFFEFLAWIGGPIYEAWIAVRDAVSGAFEWLGDMAGAAWAHIADWLGLPEDFDPIAAIQDGLQALWDGIVSLVRPMVDAVKEAWRWLREDSFLAPVFDLIAAIPELLDSLGQLWDTVTGAVGDWLGRAAEWLSDTLLPLVNEALGFVSELMHSAIDVLERFGQAVLEQLDAILGWRPDFPGIARLLDVIARLVSPMRLILQVFMDCQIAALRALADGVANLLHWGRVLLDVCTGLVQAILFIPIGTVGFLLGSVWLYLVPECYKAPLLNFILDLVIRFVRFIPEPADFMLAAIYQGALRFLETLRDADDELKVRAVDVFASIFAGNAEVAAGFLVGVGEGIWESTVGTVIFVLEIVVWLISLPFKLIAWAAGLASGEVVPEEDEEAGPAEEETTEEADETEVSEETTAEEAGGAGQRTDEETPPDAPSELPDLKTFLEQLFTTGFTRQEIQSFLDGMRSSVAGFVGDLAASAAEQMLEMLTAEGSAFAIGRVLGNIVGMLLVEIILAIVTAGGSTLITAGKVALQGAAKASKLGKALKKLKKVLDPLLDMLKKLKKTLDGLVSKIRKWIDDVLDWMKRKLKRRKKRPGRHGDGPDGPRRHHPDDPDGPRRHPDDPDAPNQRRPRDRDGDDGPSDREKARRAAIAGWRNVARYTNDRLRRPREVETRLRGVNVPGVRNVRWDLDLNRARKSWQVRAHVRAARADWGTGWIARDPDRSTAVWLADDSHQRLHADIARDTHTALKRDRDRLEGREGMSMRQIYDEMKDQARRAEQDGQRRVRLSNVRLSVEPESFRDFDRDDSLRVRVKISPNNTTVGDEGRVHYDEDVSFNLLFDGVFREAWRRAVRTKYDELADRAWVRDLQGAEAGGNGALYTWRWSSGADRRRDRAIDDSVDDAGAVFRRQNMTVSEIEGNVLNGHLRPPFGRALGRLIQRELEQAIDDSRVDALQPSGTRRRVKALIEDELHERGKGVKIKGHPGTRWTETVAATDESGSTWYREMHEEWITRTVDPHPLSDDLSQIKDYWGTASKILDRGRSPARGTEAVKAATFQAVLRELRTRGNESVDTLLRRNAGQPFGAFVGALGENLATDIRGNRVFRRAVEAAGGDRNDTSYSGSTGRVGNLTVAGDIVGVSQTLKDAVAAAEYTGDDAWVPKRIIGFMANMARYGASRTTPNITWADFDRADGSYPHGWNAEAYENRGDATKKKLNADWLKDRFRKGGGEHEWIPTARIRDVMAQGRAAADAGDAVGAARWVYGQDMMRSPTSSIIFKPGARFEFDWSGDADVAEQDATDAPPRSSTGADHPMRVGGREANTPETGVGTYTVPIPTEAQLSSGRVNLAGHVGGLYLKHPTKTEFPVVQGTHEFHGSLERVYAQNVSRGILAIAEAARDFAADAVWDGESTGWAVPTGYDLASVPLPFVHSDGTTAGVARVDSAGSTVTLTTLGELMRWQRRAYDRLVDDLDDTITAIRGFGSV